MRAPSEIKLSKLFLASVLIAFIIDLAVFVLRSSLSRANIYSDKTYYWAWAAFSIPFLLLALNKIRVRPARFLALVVIGVALAATVWYPLLDSINFIKPSYSGLVPPSASKTQKSGETALARELSFLYAADDPELEVLMGEMKAKNQPYKIGKFLFWQTGIGYGFGQRGLPKFYERGGYRFYRLALIATVGPMVIAECLINGVIKAGAAILLIQLGWFFLRKQHLLLK